MKTHSFATRADNAWLLSAILLLSGCAVGPNFQEPAPPTTTTYTPNPLTNTAESPGVSGGERQHLVTAKDIAGDWWTLFHCQPLNSLIERSLKSNPNLQAAQAALAVARENVMAQKGSFFPSVTGSLSASRQKTASDISAVPNSGDFYFNLYTPQVSVTYVPDVFGLNRRTVESLKAQEEQARFVLVATHLSLSANVVNTAITEASLREQIQATQQMITIDGDILRITRNQLAKGSATQLDVATQETQLAQVKATLPALIKQLAQTRDLLAALAGGFPSQPPSEQFTLASLQLPEELPLSLPAQLVAQRPDVRQAEENLHSASAQIGIAVANRLPNIMLTADVGSMALAAGDMLAGGTGFWTLAGGLTQPIFDGGALLHKERAARDAFTQAVDQYKATVITAMQNVADTLNALQEDAEALKAVAAAGDAAKTTLDLTRRQFQSGTVNYLALLNAEQTYDQAVVSLIQAQANRYADTAALFQALGGGWWHRPELSEQ